MSFALDRYEPIAFHTHPELMRAAEARTAVLHPATPPHPAVPRPPAATATTPVSPPPAATATPVSPPTPVAPPAAVPPPAPVPAPPAPIAAYLVGMDATPLLRSSLADFLDAAGARRDVRVSVGVATGPQVSWVLRDRVPYGVRALPRYPDAGPPPDPGAALAATAAAVVADAADDPGRRQLVVLLWDRPPEPVVPPPALRSALVLHCVDAVLTPSAVDGPAGTGWLLARSRPGPRPSVLAHAGLLLDRWEAFAALPPGLVLGQGGGPSRSPGERSDRLSERP
jgi:hypothetical protein